MNERSVHSIQSFEGSVSIPSSKSYTQRALALSLIAKEKTRLFNIGFSDDEQAALELIKRVGAKVQEFKNYLEIEGIDFRSKNEIEVSVHESGLSARMFLPLLANFDSKITLTGSGSILSRPMDFFETILPNLNVDILTHGGKLPISLIGPLCAKNLVVDGSLSSQFITGLIYAYLASPTTLNQSIQIESMTSKPYIDLTVELARKFGAKLDFNNDKIQFHGPYSLKANEIKIEGDWSSASFFVVAAALYGSVDLLNLTLDSAQGDKVILKIVEEFGAKVTSINDVIRVEKNTFGSFDFDATDCPDLFPILAVLASKGTRKSTIKGVSRLYHKESNRAVAIQSELGKMGVEISIDEKNDMMLIHPCNEVKSCAVDGHNDHRIVMACAILALGGNGETQISTPNAINKSFPSFFELLKTCVKY